MLGHGLARPGECGVDRGHGHVEEVRALRRREHQDIAEDQHDPLPGWQELQRGDKGEPDRFAGEGGGGRVDAEMGVARRADPHLLGHGGQRRGVVWDAAGLVEGADKREWTLENGP